MTGDLNLVLLTGQIITEPIKSKLNYQKTALTSFNLQTNEHYVDGTTGNHVYHPNVFSIQTLGRNADSVADRFRKGMRVYVEGYARSDENCIRTHVIRNEESSYSQKYHEGLECALEVLRTSRDKAAAIESLTALLGPS